MKIKKTTKAKIRYQCWTEEMNAIDCLEQAYHYIQQVEKKTLAWKWVIITLHGALYGFAICALKGTSSKRVKDLRKIYENLKHLPNEIKEKGFPNNINKIKYNESRKHLSFKGIMSHDERKLLLGLSKDSTYIKAIHRLFDRSRNRDLIGFNEALKRCQDLNYMRMTTESKYLQLSDQQKVSIEILKDVCRDNFEHFKPGSLSIDVSNKPQVAIDILEIIRFLALETGNYVNLTTSQERKLKSIVFQSKLLLKR